MNQQENKYIIWGCKGQSKVLVDIIGRQNVLAFFEKDSSVKSFIPDVPIYYGIDGYKKWITESICPGKICAIAAIGGPGGYARNEYFQIFKNDGFQTPSIIHKTASVLSGVQIGESCQLLAHSVMGVDASIGNACIINTKASVDHECVISDGVHIAPGATLCGEVIVGPFSFVGAGATVLPGVKIGTNVIIGAGSVVTRDLPDNVIAYGNPTQIVKENACVKFK